VNPLELRAIAYLVCALGFIYLGGHLASLHYNTIISKDRAAVAELALEASEAAKAKEEAANANNARVIAGVQARLDSVTASNADLSVRLRNAETRSRQLSQASNKPGTAPAPGPLGQPDLASVCTAVDAEDQRNAARYIALIAELKPQL
jgi:hypothetical protein